jgi:hypothetical protein
MHGFRRYWIDAIAVCAILAVFAYYAQRPYSWLLEHECSDTGSVIADEVFVKNGFELVASYWVKLPPRTGYANTYEDLLAQYPDCCGIYKGPPADYMQSPSWWQTVTNQYAKAVLVILDIKSKQGADYRTMEFSRLVTFDACGNNVPN